MTPQTSKGTCVDVPGVEVLHAPIPSREELDDRVAAALRLQGLNQPPGESWHYHRLLRVSAEKRLDEEWRANSTNFGGVGWPRRRRRLRFDLRLRRLAIAQNRFVALACAGIA